MESASSFFVEISFLLLLLEILGEKALYSLAKALE
jgi:hypothetical protein